MKTEFKSKVYTDRPPYADFDAPAKFTAIQSIIAKRLVQHPNAICSYSGGSDSDIMIDLIEQTRKLFKLPKAAVLLSIKPKYCELIASGKKTIEVRKTRPKLEPPFKCYIYCTQERMPIRDNGRILMYEDDLALTNRWGRGKRVENPQGGMFSGEIFLNCKVFGEFVCDKIITVDCDSIAPFNKESGEYIDKEACLDRDTLWKYTNGRCAYGWHISDLKIYDEPKELKEFAAFCDESENRCATCEHYLFDNDELNGYSRWCDVNRRKPLIRPPQSWCYVEAETRC